MGRDLNLAAEFSPRAVRRRQSAAISQRRVLVLDRFGFDRSVVTPRHRLLIERLAGQIASQPSAFGSLRLVGHTDSRGPSAYNHGLGLRRAEAVRQALRAAIVRRNPNLVPQVTLRIDSLGAAHPVARGGDPQSRARNRRVVILASGTPAPSPRLDRAVHMNRLLSRSLGWQAYRVSLQQLLGFGSSTPDERTFAAAVVRWQQGRSHLIPDGIVETKTAAAMRAALNAPAPASNEAPSAELSAQELTPDSATVRWMLRESQYAAGAEADKFVTEQVRGFPEGHQKLTSMAASGFAAIGPRDRIALRDGVTRVDDPKKSLPAPEQRRHTLRKEKCQSIPAALNDAREHLKLLHHRALTAPNRQVQFEMIGEALHLVQDSFSPAHTERAWAGAGGVHPILFIRFFGFDNSLPYPIEHRVFPVPDPRDCLADSTSVIKGCGFGGGLTRWASEAVAASREFLTMVLRHIPAGPGPVPTAELTAFMDRHLLLSPTHTPTTKFYPSCPP